MWSARREDNRTEACDSSTWWPQALGGQCFGLGAERLDALGGERIATAEGCMQACCGDTECHMWQFRPVGSPGPLTLDSRHGSLDSNLAVRGRRPSRYIPYRRMEESWVCCSDEDDLPPVVRLAATPSRL